MPQFEIINQYIIDKWSEKIRSILKELLYYPRLVVLIRLVSVIYDYLSISYFFYYIMGGVGERKNENVRITNIRHDLEKNFSKSDKDKIVGVLLDIKRVSDMVRHNTDYIEDVYDLVLNFKDDASVRYVLSLLIRDSSILNTLTSSAFSEIIKREIFHREAYSCYVKNYMFDLMSSLNHRVFISDILSDVKNHCNCSDGLLNELFISLIKNDYYINSEDSNNA